MSDRLRAFRDQLQRGDDVLVSNHGPRPRKARVAEVLRAAVRVNYYDKPGMQETVLFKDITRVEDETRKPPPAAAVVVMRPRTEPEPEVIVEVPAPPKDDLTAWLDMGRDMAERIRAEVKQLEHTEQQLRLDAKQLEQAADTAAAERVELQRKLTAVLAITGGKA